jgi:hypothetical protein
MRIYFVAFCFAHLPAAPKQGTCQDPSTMESLPDELLLEILLQCQPHYTLDLSNLWTLQTHIYPHLTQHWLNKRTEKILVLSETGAKDTSIMFGSTGFHSTLSLSYKRIPVLVILSQVSHRFRRLALSHPIHASLGWHYMLRRPHQPQGASVFAEWLELHAPHIPNLTTSSIILDPELMRLDMLPRDVRALCRTTRRPELVHTLVMCMGWLTLGDHSLLKFLVHIFPNIKRLYINGRPSVGVLHGLDNRALKIMGQWNELTHLFVDGYGGGSFTMKGLSYILSPSLKSLSLGYVRHGIDFGVLADKCPNIETLCVTFSVLEPVMYMDNDCEVAALRRSMARECVPELQGRIAELKHLKCVWLYDSQGSEDVSGDTVREFQKETPSEILFVYNGVIDRL